MEEEKKDKKYRAFHIVLYIEDETHTKALDYIVENYNQYAYIIHNRDITEDGTIKKEHIHVVLKFASARHLPALADELGIMPNYIEPCKKNYIYALRYLIHLDEEDKVPYQVEEVVGPLRKKLIQSINDDKGEDSFVLDILKLLETKSEILTLSEFLRLICAKGLFSYYRRSQITFIRLLDEHNNNLRS